MDNDRLSASLFIVGLLSLSANAVEMESNGDCPSNLLRLRYTTIVRQHAEKCFQFVNKEMSWPASRDYCWQHGSRLVKIADQSTQDFIITTLNDLWSWDNSGVWLGLHDREQEARYQWITTDPYVHEPLTASSWTNWGKGQPKHSRFRNCVRMIRGSGDWKWRDTICDLPTFWKYRFICEYEGLLMTTSALPTTGALPLAVSVTVTPEELQNQTILSNGLGVTEVAEIRQGKPAALSTDILFGLIATLIVLTLVCVIILIFFIRRRRRKLLHNQSTATLDNKAYTKDVENDAETKPEQGLTIMEQVGPINDYVPVARSLPMLPLENTYLHPSLSISRDKVNNAENCMKDTDGKGYMPMDGSVMTGCTLNDHNDNEPIEENVYMEIKDRPINIYANCKQDANLRNTSSA